MVRLLFRSACSGSVTEDEQFPFLRLIANRMEVSLKMLFWPCWVYMPWLDVRTLSKQSQVRLFLCLSVEAGRILLSWCVTKRF